MFPVKLNVAHTLAHMNVCWFVSVLLFLSSIFVVVAVFTASYGCVLSGVHTQTRNKMFNIYRLNHKPLPFGEHWRAPYARKMNSITACFSVMLLLSSLVIGVCECVCVHTNEHSKKLWYVYMRYTCVRACVCVCMQVSKPANGRVNEWASSRPSDQVNWVCSYATFVVSIFFVHFSN